jgi:hypothetical protein
MGIGIGMPGIGIGPRASISAAICCASNCW